MSDRHTFTYREYLEAQPPPPDEQLVCSHCGIPLSFGDLTDDTCPECGGDDVHLLYPEAEEV